MLPGNLLGSFFMDWIYSEWLTPPDRHGDEPSPFYPWPEDDRLAGLPPG